MSLIVQNPGLLSLLVDRGRPRERSRGLPLSGAADRGACALANGLVGNLPEALALEVTLTGPTLVATKPIAGIVFGASFQISINGTPVSIGSTFSLEAGDLLRIGGCSAFVRGYFCVAGGFESREIMGSCSGFEPVRKGDLLVCRAARIQPRALPFHTSLMEEALPHKHWLLRVLVGPQRDWFNGELFFEQAYQVTPLSNRMGIRLRGEVLTRKPGELTSEAVAPGAVQITNDGQPIVLGVDGQTIGGYPKIAHVIRADLDLLGQLRPGDRVRFHRVSPNEAEQAAQQRAACIKEWLIRLRIADRQPSFLAE